MFTICKRFHFSAAHHLPYLPEDHKCRRPHGHNYQVELILASTTLNEHGFVVDYAAMHSFKEYLDNELDHRDLNEVLAIKTTAEHIARYLYIVAATLFPQVGSIKVRVSETPDTWAEYDGL